MYVNRMFPDKKVAVFLLPPWNVDILIGKYLGLPDVPSGLPWCKVVIRCTLLQVAFAALFCSIPCDMPLPDSEVAMLAIPQTDKQVRRTRRRWRINPPYKPYKVSAANEASWLGFNLVASIPVQTT